MSDENPQGVNSARLTANGPLLLTGRIRHSARPGEPPAEYTQVALCRCGASASKPFCDGSHARVGFIDRGVCVNPPQAATVPAHGDVVLNPIANGPLRVDGGFELTATDGTRVACGEKTWLCRCGASANKPFCDGTHKKIGFTA